MKNKILLPLTASCLVVFLFLLTTDSFKKGKTIHLDPKHPVSIELWHYYNGPQKIAFDKLVLEFNETVGLKKGIIVEAFSQGNINDLQNKILDSVNKKVGAQKPPNAFSAYSDTAYQMNKMGLLADLSAYLPPSEAQEYVDSYIEEGRLGQKNALKIFPIAKSTEFLMVNKTDWDKFSNAAGVKIENLKTWEGIAATAKKYYDWTDSQTPAPNDGKAFFGRDAVANYILVGSKQLGSELFDVQNDKVTLRIDEKVMRRLWDNFYLPYVNGYYGAYGKFRSDDAKTGDIIALVCSTSGAAYFPDSVTLGDSPSYAIEQLTLPLPNFENTEPYAVQQGAGMVVLKSDEAHEYACAEFLKWFVESERNINFAARSGYLPVKKAANSLSLIDKKFLSNNAERVGDHLKQALPVAIQQLQSYRLYTSKPFQNSSNARKILENALLNKAKTDRATVVELMNQGMSHTQAVQKVATDQNFKMWLAGLKQSLQVCLETETGNK